mmetsp:Transcript_9636/g.10977  ORF Transcript_9636/g.10977 Transcript_9636/m.10977 type:complete len:366 (+) Transcript_9636:277-1374(+)
MTNCLTFEPFPECGFYGSCVPTGNGTSECICDDGYSQHPDFAIYFVEKEELNTMICIYHDATVETMYYILFVLCLLYFAVQALVLRSKSQLRRQIPTLVFAFVVSIVALYRIIRDKNAGFGDDVFFTFMISTFGVLSQVQGYLFLTHYLSYISKKVQFGENKALYLRANNARLIYKYIIIISCVGGNLIWMMLWAPNDAALVVFRVWVFLQIVRISYQQLFTQACIRSLIKDMQSILDVTMNSNSDLQHSLKKRIPKVRKLKNRLLILGILEGIIWVPIVFWDLAVLWGAYLLPLLFILVLTWSFVVILSKQNTFGCGGIRTSRLSSNGNETGEKRAVSEYIFEKSGLTGITDVAGTRTSHSSQV